jgi:ABC-type polysaccharide transport system permease subunit
MQLSFGQAGPSAKAFRPERGKAPFLLSLPFIAFFIVFNYVPLAGWIYAFFDYTPGLPLSKAPFEGFKYFTMMFAEWEQTGMVIRNTLVLSGLGILFSPLPVVFAVFLNEVTNKHVRKIIQTTTTLPNFIGWIIVYGLAFAFFSMDGMVNTVFVKLGLMQQPQNFLGDSGLAWLFQTMLGIWKGLGWNSIIYLAAISGIDQELYTAAKVDGAGRFRSMIHVTLPGVASTYFVLLLLGISNILSNGFDQYYVFSNPLVSDKLLVLDLYVYNLGIVYSQYSYSVAIGIWKTLIGILLLVGANTLSKRVRGDSIF